MPDMTGEFKRKLDLADKASIDLIALNNKLQYSKSNKEDITVVAMRLAVKRSKLYVINKITTNIKKLRQKKGTEEQKKQNATKADKLVEEIKIIKMLKPDYVSKYALGTTETFQKIVCEANLGMERRALARLAEHRFIQDFVKKFREEHNDWKELTAYLMTKHTSREYKKRRNKQKLQNTDKVAMNIKVTEKIVESYLGDKLKHLGEEIGKEASELDKKLKNESKPGSLKSGKGDEGVLNKKGFLSKGKVGDNIDESDSDSSEQNTSSDEKSDRDVSTRKQSLDADDNSNIESEDGDSGDSDENESSDIGDSDNSSDSESGRKLSDVQRSSNTQLLRGETSSSESDFEDVRIKLNKSEMDAKNKSVQSSVKVKNNWAKQEKVKKKMISNSQNEKEKLVSEKKSGEMIVKRINLEELKDDTIDAESSNKVPEFLLETALTKSKRKTNDPFFCASDEENDDDDKNSAQAEYDDDDDEDNDIDDEFGNSEFTGISGLSTTFVGSLKSDEMMKCSKQFRSNEDWKKLRQEKFTRGSGRRGGGQSFRGRGGSSQGGRGQDRGDRGISRGHMGGSQGRGRGGSDLGSSQSQQRQQPDFKKSLGESLLQPSYLSHVREAGSKPMTAAKEGNKSGENLHPSWIASKKRKEQQTAIPAFEGKKIKFDD